LEIAGIRSHSASMIKNKIFVLGGCDASDKNSTMLLSLILKYNIGIIQLSQERKEALLELTQQLVYRTTKYLCLEEEMVQTISMTCGSLTQSPHHGPNLRQQENTGLPNAELTQQNTWMIIFMSLEEAMENKLSMTPTA